MQQFTLEEVLVLIAEAIETMDGASVADLLNQVYGGVDKKFVYLGDNVWGGPQDVS